MPVLIWDLSNDHPVATVETDWATFFSPEEVREEAEELDRELDSVLNKTLDILERVDSRGVPVEFLRAWSIGKALREEQVVKAPAMRNEPRHRLWHALSRKCRTGARADGSIEPRWKELRPSTAREPRREGRRLDYFELCLWLAEQEFDAANQVFGGSVRNAWQMLERPTLRPIVVRGAFQSWLQQLHEDRKNRAVDPRVFSELMKRLRARWPDRGPGSARRPAHQTEDELVGEMHKLLDPIIDGGGIASG